MRQSRQKIHSMLEIRSLSPFLGQHTDEVLRQVLKSSDDVNVSRIQVKVFFTRCNIWKHKLIDVACKYGYWFGFVHCIAHGVEPVGLHSGFGHVWEKLRDRDMQLGHKPPGPPTVIPSPPRFISQNRGFWHGKGRECSEECTKMTNSHSRVISPIKQIS